MVNNWEIIYSGILKFKDLNTVNSRYIRHRYNKNIFYNRQKVEINQTLNQMKFI